MTEDKIQQMDVVFDTMLIIGGTGSLAQALVSRWAQRVRKFIIFSRSEHKQWELQQMFSKVQFQFELGDVADTGKVRSIMLRYDPTIILYVAAMKHVDKCETNIIPCLSTNCIGFAQMLSTLEDMLCCVSTSIRLKNIVYVSTDKACDPNNIYGMSKSISEHVVQNISSFYGICVLGVRFGNFINSRGSIIPVLKRQCEESQFEALTITDSRMTRFFMTLADSAQLIEDAMQHGKCGDIWIPEMSSMRIIDLFNLFSRKYGKPIKQIGMRDGEKLHETLIGYHDCPYVKKIEIRGNIRYVINKRHDPQTIILPKTSAETNLLNAEQLQELIKDVC